MYLDNCPRESVSWVYSGACLCFVRAESRATGDITIASQSLLACLREFPWGHDSCVKLCNRSAGSENDARFFTETWRHKELALNVRPSLTISL